MIVLLFLLVLAVLWAAGHSMVSDQGCHDPFTAEGAALQAQLEH